MFEFGGWWLPEGETHMVEYLSVQPAYQGPHRATALEYVPRFRTAVDIGGHVGLWSRELATRFATVHAFEPVDAHAECFVRTVPAQNVQLHRCALGAEPGFVEPEIASEGNTGTTSLYPSGSGLPVRTLESFALEDVDFVKIDVEGAQLLVCRGAAHTLARWRPALIIEQRIVRGVLRHPAVRSAGLRVRTGRPCRRACQGRLDPAVALSPGPRAVPTRDARPPARVLRTPA